MQEEGGKKVYTRDGKICFYVEACFSTEGLSGRAPDV